MVESKLNNVRLARLVVLKSDLLQHLAGHEGDFSHHENWSGPDPDSDPNNLAVTNKNKKHTRFSRKGDKAKGTVNFWFYFVLGQVLPISNLTRGTFDSV